MKNIVFFNDFGLPLSCANATRVWNFAKMLEKQYEITVIGVSYGDNNKTSLVGEYKQFSYSMLKAPNMKGWKAIRRRRILAKMIEKELSNILNKGNTSAIILSNIYFDYSSCLIKLSEKYGVPLIVNEVEWYEKDNDYFAGLFGKVKLLQNRIALTDIHVRMKNIIAISSLLDKYYTSHGCNTVKIPTIIDMDEYNDYKNFCCSNEKLIIAYAGSPAKKDYVGNAIIALSMLEDETRKRICLHFYGATKETFIDLGLQESILDTVSSSVVFHGRIPHEEVKKQISKADFTILLRPNKRYANAGFPTKVGESMACGVPVIGNITSDLGEFYVDGYNAIVCRDETPESCAEAFRKGLSLTEREKNSMRKNAYETAMKKFDLSEYSEKMKNFLMMVL